MIDIQTEIKSYEALCDCGQAQHQDAQASQIKIKNFLEFRGYEYCSHNLAILGSKRYACYRNKNLKRCITKSEWKKLSDQQIKDFEKLKSFPWDNK